MPKVAIDNSLLRKAHRLSGLRTWSETINAALVEYIRYQQLKIFDLAGTVDYDPGYNYKKQRRRSSR
jgi:hypothetical protein